LQAPVIINGDVFDTYKYKMNVSGPYHRVTQFLTNIGTMTRIVAPINVALSPPAAAGRKLGDPNEQVLDVQFEVQTYVAKAGAGVRGP